MDAVKKRIRIVKNGPYVVSGGIPLSEKIIRPKGRGYEMQEGGSLPQSRQYALCRCGKSKNPPFCDGTHAKAGFSGTETADRAPFLSRSEVFKGPKLDLLDDNRCAYARFCHRDKGSAWELTQRSRDPDCREEAVIAACECPAGRLVARDKDGNLIEPKLEPAVEVLQDPEEGVSGGFYVKGHIEIESSDGSVYEPRNRVVLCRCGHSCNKPFCDASHVTKGYKDR